MYSDRNNVSETTKVHARDFVRAVPFVPAFVTSLIGCLVDEIGVVMAGTIVDLTNCSYTHSPKGGRDKFFTSTLYPIFPFLFMVRREFVAQSVQYTLF